MLENVGFVAPLVSLLLLPVLSFMVCALMASVMWGATWNKK